MTTHSDKADDLVERLLGYSSMNDHLSWRSKCERDAATYIKVLKAEVERLRALIGDHDLIEAGAYATMTARAAKAEEALREIRALPMLTRSVPDSTMRSLEHDVYSAYRVQAIVAEALGEGKA